MKYILLILLLSLPFGLYALSETSIVAYWKMNEASGATRNDSTANAYNLTNNGTVTGVTGIASNGASGWSEANYLSRVDNDSFDLTGSWTVSFWIRSSAWTANAMSIISKEAAGSGWVLYLQGSGGAPVFQVNQATNMIGTNSLSTNTWYHYCIYSNGSQITFRRNGAEDTAAQTFTAPNVNTAALWFGRRATEARPMNSNAIIDEATIYTRTLTSAECDELYGSGTPPSYPFASSPTPLQADSWFGIL